MKDIDIKLYLMWSDYKLSLMQTYAMFTIWWWIVRSKPYLSDMGETIDFFWDNLSFNNNEY